MPLELAGQCCFQPACKARQAMACLEVWLFAFVLIQQRGSSCRGEDGLAPLSGGSQLAARGWVPWLPHTWSHTLLSNSGCSRDELCQTCAPAWNLWKPCPKISSITACSSSKYQTQGSSDHSHDQTNLPFLSTPARVHTQSCNLPREAVICPFSDREGHKWSFTAPCVCSFVQVSLWLMVHLIKTFIEHVEGTSSVAALPE